MPVARTIRTLLARTPCRVIGGDNWDREVRVLTTDGLMLNVDIDHLDVQGFTVVKPYDADDNARRLHLQALVKRARLDLFGDAANKTT